MLPRGFVLSMNVKVDFSVKGEPKWFCVKRHKWVFVAAHPARRSRSSIFSSSDILVHMFDAILSLIYILFDISDNCNKFILGTAIRQGPDKEI